MTFVSKLQHDISHIVGSVENDHVVLKAEKIVLGDNLNYPIEADNDSLLIVTKSMKTFINTDVISMPVSGNTCWPFADEKCIKILDKKYNETSGNWFW